MDTRDALLAGLLRVADDHLVLGHRLSEWCGHAPMLEEDLALPNIALDLLGQARALYTYAGEVEGLGRDEDAFAYLRREREYANLLMLERPNGDFGQTMLRQLYFSGFMEGWWTAATASTDTTLAAIAAKAVKETAYHVRHSAEWVIRLGDGTEESAARMHGAVDALAPYVDEMFLPDAVTTTLAEAGLQPDPTTLRPDWDVLIAKVFRRATLAPVTVRAPITGGRDGRHTEDMGFLLAQLQALPRAYPGATW